MIEFPALNNEGSLDELWRVGVVKQEPHNVSKGIVRWSLHDFEVIITRNGFVNHHFVAVRKEGLKRYQHSLRLLVETASSPP